MNIQHIIRTQLHDLRKSAEIAIEFGCVLPILGAPGTGKKSLLTAYAGSPEAIFHLELGKTLVVPEDCRGLGFGFNPGGQDYFVSRLRPQVH